MKTHISVLFSVTALAALLFVGCTDSGADRAARFTNELDSTRGTVITTSESIDNVMVSLRELIRRPGNDLQSQYSAFTGALSRAESASTDFSNQMQRLAKNAGNYFASWEQESAEIASDDVRSISEQRRESVLSQYFSIREQGQLVESEYELFLSDLRDVRRYLNTDLTPSGIRAISGFLDRVETRGRPMQDQLGRMGDELNALARTLRPGGEMGN